MNFDAHSSELFEKMMESKYNLSPIVTYKIITAQDSIMGFLITKAVWYKLRIFELKYINGCSLISEKSEQYLLGSSAIERMENLIQKFNHSH